MGQRYGHNDGAFIAFLLRFEVLFRLAASLPHPVFREVFLASPTPRPTPPPIPPGLSRSLIVSCSVPGELIC